MNNTRIEKIEKEREKIIKELETKSNDIKEFINTGKLLTSTEEGKRFFDLAYKLFVKPTEEKIALIENDNQFLLGKVIGEYKTLKNIIIPFINNYYKGEKDV